jgi:hypothetical protein
MPHQSSSNASSTLGKMIIDHFLPPAPEPEPKHDHSKHDHSDIDGLYTYRASDFGGQDYLLGTDILTGDFNVSLKNSSGMRVGMISWMCVAQPRTADYPTEHLSVHENITISFGLENNAHTCHGSNLSISRGGFYEEGTTYYHEISGHKGGRAIVAITNVGNGIRNVDVKSVKQ